MHGGHARLLHGGHLLLHLLHRCGLLREGARHGICLLLCFGSHGCPAPAGTLDFLHALGVQAYRHDSAVAHIVLDEDGAAGVELAKNLQPDLILMDVVMPNLNGFQATRSITREPTTKHIPVILVTTKDQDTDRVWGMRQGAKAYITKPFSESELSELITQYLGSGGPTAA